VKDMASQPLRAAVVGCGFIAQSIHIPSLLKAKAAELAAVCDKNEELAKNVARKFGIDKYYSDFGEMLNQERPDVVDVCTAIGTHAALSIQAMDAGCHVLVEKPMALTGDEADEMIKASLRNGVRLGVVHDMLFGLAMMRVKSMVSRGIIGDLVGVEIKQSCPPQDFPVISDPTHWWHKLPGGVFGDTLPHPLYLAREFLGELTPLAVYAGKLGHLEHMRFDELRIILEGEKGIATIISSCSMPSLMVIDIFGTRMNLHGNLYNGVVIKYRGKSDMGQGSPPRRALENVNWSFQLLSNTLSTGARVFLGKRGGHRVLISEFIESVQNGTEPPVTAEDGRRILGLLEEITRQMTRN
jgi:predicted dehydrogenase